MGLTIEHKRKLSASIKKTIKKKKEPEKFCDFIREARDRKKLSCRKLAKLVECTDAFISDIENNWRFPGPNLSKKLSDVLEVRFERFEEEYIKRCLLKWRGQK